jgi:hypothetical protein
MGAVRELQIYDGRDRIGRVILDAGGKAKAYNVKGKSIRAFANLKEATNAIEVARSKRRATINDPQASSQAAADV